MNCWRGLRRISRWLSCVKRQQREQELRVDAETALGNLATILSSISEVFVTLDRDWRYTYVNNKTVEVSGIPKEDFLGKCIWEVFPDTVGSLLYTELHRAVTEQTPIQFEYFYPTWNRWFENRVYPSANGVSLFITEITDRKQAEKALRESEERFRQMAETIRDVFWLLNPQTGRHLYISPAYETIWGAPVKACTAMLVAGLRRSTLTIENE